MQWEDERNRKNDADGDWGTEKRKPQVGERIRRTDIIYRRVRTLRVASVIGESSRATVVFLTTIGLSFSQLVLSDDDH